MDTFSVIEPISHSSQLRGDVRYLVKIIKSQIWECMTYDKDICTFVRSDGQQFAWCALLVYRLNFM